MVVPKELLKYAEFTLEIWEESPKRAYWQKSNNSLFVT